MTAYATRRDLYRYGLPRGTLSSEGREVSSSVASTNVLTLTDHGFETDDEVLVRALEDGTLSAPLVAGTTYYAIRLTADTFSLATAAAGSAIDLTTNGTTMWISTELPFDDVLEFYSRFVDAFIPAHLVPLESPCPVTVVALVAELAAKKLQLLAGVSSVVMTELELAAKAQLERWAKGLPLRDAAVTTSASKAISSTLSSVADPRGWHTSTGGGSIP
ncbi:MAG: hypothetical protein A3E78_14510 [Alphaproteobacteria bacterium RIFCSPHIGHO2_12_FULL_63_12]|nr:MAG: hypothetical protein A3E78_14510 [Alphaproteobacteria bacterium RIFCSPHIGHO2_12_FULL_63_12]